MTSQGERLWHNKLRHIFNDAFTLTQEREVIRAINGEIARLCKLNRELVMENLNLKNPNKASIYWRCKKGHKHFLFDCEGCQYELEEYLSGKRK